MISPHMLLQSARLNRKLAFAAAALLLAGAGCSASAEPFGPTSGSE
jgi:hypothetical protein